MGQAKQRGTRVERREAAIGRVARKADVFIEVAKIVNNRRKVKAIGFWTTLAIACAAIAYLSTGVWG